MPMLATRRRERERNPLLRLQDEMDDLFSSFFEEGEMPLLHRGRWPVMDIEETDKEFIVKAEVPGCKAEDIDISVYGNRLIISGEKKKEEEAEKKGYFHAERMYGSFRRECVLRSDVDAEHIEATFKNGVLRINLPKTEKTSPVKVKIKSQ